MKYILKRFSSTQVEKMNLLKYFTLEILNEDFEEHLETFKHFI